MDGKFKLEITLGNSDMSSNEDIAKALRVVSYELEYGHTEGKIRDINGNTVGSFKIVNE